METLHGELLNKVEGVRNELSKVIRGKIDKIDIVLMAVIARGHILLEDLPGVGKTTLAKALAQSMKLEFSRIQFTPDLLPSDLLGMSILNPKDGTLSFNNGPVFTNLLLADEINRASPRTQSALLEAMNENQVSIDNKTRVLANPFIVIATQNPIEHQGTYPLPEAQLDRFLVKVSLGYPAFDEELKVLRDRDESDPLLNVKQILSAKDVIELQQSALRVSVEQDVAKYILNIVNATREHSDIEIGASPRASLGLYGASKAKAFMSGRDFVTPFDVQQIAPYILEHRVLLSSAARYGGTTIPAIIREIIDTEKVPV